MFASRIPLGMPNSNNPPRLEGTGFGTGNRPGGVDTSVGKARKASRRLRHFSAAGRRENSQKPVADDDGSVAFYLWKFLTDVVNTNFLNFL